MSKSQISNIQIKFKTEPSTTHKFLQLCQTIFTNTGITGANNKPYPQVQLIGFDNSRYNKSNMPVIEVTLVTEDTKHVHPYKIQAKSSNQLELKAHDLTNSEYMKKISNKCYFLVSLEDNTADLEGINITIVPESKINKAIENQNLKMSIQEYGDLNKCRLKIQLACFDTNSKQIIRIDAGPVYSNTIRNTILDLKRQITISKKLTIEHMSTDTCHMSGNTEVFLLTTPIERDNIEILFYLNKDEKNMDNMVKAEFNRTDVYNNCGIIFRTPPLKQLYERINTPFDANNLKFARAYFCLYRPSDKQFSDEKIFYYVPMEINLVKLYPTKFMKRLHGQTVDDKKEDKMETDDEPKNKKQKKIESITEEDIKKMDSKQLRPTLDRFEKNMNELAERTSNAILKLAETRSLSHLLLTQRCLLDVQDDEGNTPIHLSIINRHLDLLELFIDAISTIPEKKIIDIRNFQHLTPLLLAAHLKESEACEFLLEEGGSNIYDSDRRGYNSFHIAAKNGDSKLIETLVNYIKSDKTKTKFNAINQFTNDGRTPLQIASSLNNGAQIVEKLLTVTEIDVNRKSLTNGYTALHYAVASNNFKICRLLLEHKDINVDYGAFNGMTPLHLAADNKCYLVARLLLKHKASLSIVSYECSKCAADDSDDEEESMKAEVSAASAVATSSTSTSQKKGKKSKGKKQPPQVSSSTSIETNESSQLYSEPKVEYNAHHYAHGDEIMLTILKNEKQVSKALLNKIFKHEMQVGYNKLTPSEKEKSDKKLIDMINDNDNKIDAVALVQAEIQKKKALTGDSRTTEVVEMDS